MFVAGQTWQISTNISEHSTPPLSRLCRIILVISSPPLSQLELKHVSITFASSSSFIYCFLSGTRFAESPPFDCKHVCWICSAIHLNQHLEELSKTNNMPFMCRLLFTLKLCGFSYCPSLLQFLSGLVFSGK